MEKSAVAVLALAGGEFPLDQKNEALGIEQGKKIRHAFLIASAGEFRSLLGNNRRHRPQPCPAKSPSQITCRESRGLSGWRRQFLSFSNRL